MVKKNITERWNHEKKTNPNTEQGNLGRWQSIMDRPQAKDRPEKAHTKPAGPRNAGHLVHNGTVPKQRKAYGKDKRINAKKRYARPPVLYKGGTNTPSRGGSAKMRCTDCGSDIRLNFERGEKYCKVCGLVIEDQLPEQHHTKPENRVFHRPSTIKAGGFMPNGNVFKATWMLTSKEKNILSARKKIGAITARLDLPEYVYKEACSLYKQAIYRDLSVGRDNNSLVYACIYAACQITSLPKTKKEIIRYATTVPRGMMKSYKLLREKFNLKINLCDPVELLHQYTTKLNISPKTEIKICKLVERIKKTNLFAGRQPESIIAAAIYLECKRNNEFRSQREISGAVGVIEITIRHRYREIEKVETS